MAKRKKGNDPSQPFEQPIVKAAPRPVKPETRRGYRVDITAAQVQGPTSYGRLWEVTVPAHPEVEPIIVEAHDATEAVRACRLVRRRDYGDFPLRVDPVAVEEPKPEPAKPLADDETVIGSSKIETIPEV